MFIFTLHIYVHVKYVSLKEHRVFYMFTLYPTWRLMNTFLHMRTLLVYSNTLILPLHNTYWNILQRSYCSFSTPSTLPFQKH